MGAARLVVPRLFEVVRGSRVVLAGCRLWQRPPAGVVAGGLWCAGGALGVSRLFVGALVVV